GLGTAWARCCSLALRFSQDGNAMVNSRHGINGRRWTGGEFFPQTFFLQSSTGNMRLPQEMACNAAAYHFTCAGVDIATPEKTLGRRCLLRCGRSEIHPCSCDRRSFSGDHRDQDLRMWLLALAAQPI